MTQYNVRNKINGKLSEEITLQSSWITLDFKSKILLIHCTKIQQKVFLIGLIIAFESMLAITFRFVVIKAGGDCC